jgi:hypothetical protein
MFGKGNGKEMRDKKGNEMATGEVFGRSLWSMDIVYWRASTWRSKELRLGETMSLLLPTCVFIRWKGCSERYFVGNFF